MFKTCFILKSMGSGGTSQVIIRLAIALHNLGFRVTIVTTNSIEPNISKLIPKHLQIIQLNATNSFFSAVKLARFLLLYKPQCIISFNYTIPFTLVFLRKLGFHNSKIIMRSMNTMSYKLEEEMGSAFSFLLKRLIRLGIVNCDLIINQCREMENDTLSYLGKSCPPVTHIYNPISPVSIIKTQSRNHYNILCVARHEKQKDIQSAIKLVQILNGRGLHYQLYLAGDGSLTNDLKLYVKEQGLQNCVSFLGHVHDMKPLYSSCGVSILTSHYEGFPNALIESIAFGVPVVAFDCPCGPKEIIKDGVNGYIVIDRDLNTMAEKIIMSQSLISEQIQATTKIFHPNYVARKYISTITKSISFDEN